MVLGHDQQHPKWARQIKEDEKEEEMLARACSPYFWLVEKFVNHWLLTRKSFQAKLNIFFKLHRYKTILKMLESVRNM